MPSSIIGYPNVEERGQLPGLSTWDVIQKSLTLPAKKSMLATQTMDVYWGTREKVNQNLVDAIQLSEKQINDPNLSWGQYAASSIASLAGNILDPTSFAFGLGAGKVASGAVNLGLKLLPESLNKEILPFVTSRFHKLLPKNVAEALKFPTVSGATMIGFTLPESVNQNFNPENNQFDKSGFIKAISYQGGIGAALSPIWWLSSHVLNKAFKGVQIAEDVDRQMAFVKKAFKKGDVSKEEFKWFEEYVKNPEKLDTHREEAARILSQDKKLSLNILTGNLDHNIFSADEIKNMSTLYYDKLAANLSKEYYNEGTDFLAHNILDRNVNMLLDNPGMLDTIKVYLERLNSKLKIEKGRLEKYTNYVNRVVEHESLSEEALSQEELYKMLNKGKVATHELPFNIPRNIELRTKRDLKISNLKKQIGILKRTKGDDRLPKLERLNKKLEKETAKHLEKNKILSMDEELTKIEKKFLGKEELPANFNVKPEFFRLHDLARINKKAAILLDKITAKAGFEMQEAFHDIYDGFVKVAENAFREAANPQKMVDYFKHRLEQASNFRAPLKISSETIGTKTKIKETPILTPDQIEDSFEKINSDEAISDEVKNEVTAIYSKIKQLKNGEKALNEFVNCIRESINAIG